MSEVVQAIVRGDEEAVCSLLDADPTLIEEGRVMGRPLAVAATHGQLGMVQLLVWRGADLEATGTWGMTALHNAVDAGHEEVVDYLLGSGARADCVEEFGMTPLKWACEKGRMGVLRVLLRHMGAEGLGERDAHGKTALHFAAVRGREEVAAFLLARGAQARLRDYSFKTALMHASIRGHLGVVQAIVQHMGKEGMEDKDDLWKTALHWAAYMGRVEVVVCLLLHGADPRVRDHEGMTPAALAQRYARGGCVAVFKWWEGELERGYLLSRATCMHRNHMVQRYQPTSQVPTYLEARVAAGHAVPRVEVVSPQSEGRQEAKKEEADTRGHRKAVDEEEDTQGAYAGEEERHAVLDYVMTGLNEALLIELLAGFHPAK